MQESAGISVIRGEGLKPCHGWRRFFKMGLLIVFPMIVLSGCEAVKGAAKETSEFLVVAEWNVQALFDGQETGNEYGEYLESAGWTKEKYLARVTAISRAVLSMVREEVTPAEMGLNAAALKQKVPDIIGFIEVENVNILLNLAEGELSKQGYLWAAFAKLPGSSLGIGFLSRFPFEDIRTHMISAGVETAPRPVLEVKIAPRGKPIVLLLCHWKSKLGNIDVTEAQRRSSARVIQRRIRELNETEAGMPVIVLGDLNENHDEYYRRAVFSALLPDDPLAAATAEAKKSPGASQTQEFLVLSEEKPPRSIYFPEGTPALYSPWNGDLSEGSYHYKGEWETIDHFLLSNALFDGTGWEYSGCRVLNQGPFAAASGIPDAYVPRSGRGLSDHLPLLLYLRDVR